MSSKEALTMMQALNHYQYVFDITLMLLNNGAVDLLYDADNAGLADDFVLSVRNIVDDEENDVDPGMEICLIELSIPIYQRFLKEINVI